MYNIKKFDNGLTLIHAKNPTVKSVAIGVYVRVGSSAEDDRTNGIAHFIEHMLFKGTDRRNAYQLVSEIEDIGAVINASTSKEITNYYTHSLSEHTEECMDILSDIFFNSVFPEEEMEKEKNVVLEEIAMCNDTPDDVCMEIATSAFFSDNAYGRTILGPAENIKAFTKDDILKFMSDHYTADATVISIVGDVEFSEAVEYSQKYFADKFTSNTAKEIVIEQNFPKTRYVYKEKDIEQANVSVVFPSLSYAEDGEIELQILNVILGSCMSSRLFQRIREEKGLAYSIYTYPGAYLKDGYFLTYLGTSTDKVKDALVTIKHELDAFLKDGITDAELKRAKEQLKSSCVMNNEDTRSVMRIIGRYYLLREEIYSMDARLQAIESVTKADVMNVAKKIFDYTKVTLSYVGQNVDKELLDAFLNA